MRFTNLGEHVSSANTVKMAKIEYDPSVSDQGFLFYQTHHKHTSWSEQLCTLMGWSNVDLKTCMRLM